MTTFVIAGGGTTINNHVISSMLVDCGFVDGTATNHDSTYFNDNNFPQVTEIKNLEDPLILAIIKNNIHNKIMHKFIQLSFDLSIKHKIKIMSRSKNVLTFKNKKSLNRQNIGIINFKKEAA